MVDLDSLYEVIELRVRSGTGVKVVYLRARHVRRGHQGENFLGRATDAAGRDLIAGELIADVTAIAVRTGAVRIENRNYPSGAAQLAEIAAAKSHRWNRKGGSARSRKFVEELLAVEEKRAVPAIVHLWNVDRTAEHSTTLVLMRDRNSALKERSRAFKSLWEKVKRLAMQLVGSRAEDEVREPRAVDRPYSALKLNQYRTRRRFPRRENFRQCCPSSPAMPPGSPSM